MTHDGAAQRQKWVALVGASIGEAWNLERLGERVALPGYRFSHVGVPAFDEGQLIGLLARGGEKPAIVMIGACAASFPGDAATHRRVVTSWVEQLRRAGIQPVLVTTAPVARPSSHLDRMRRAVRRVAGRRTRDDAVVEFNDWLRVLAGRECLRVFDLEAVLRQGASQRWLREEYDGGDGLHLNAAAYREMDLALADFFDPRGRTTARARGDGLEAVPPGLIRAVRRDIDRFFELDSRDGNPGLLEKLRILLAAPGLHAVLVYRLGSWAHRGVRARALSCALKLAHTASSKICIGVWGIDIDVGAQIGEGLYIGHFGGVVIGPAKIGRDCNIAHQVTIGRRADGVPGVPVLGDRVWVGAGSVLFGNVTIGDGATVGPLTAVCRNLPPRVVVMGNPMVVVKKDYDNSAEVYGRRGAKGGVGRPPEPQPVPPAGTLNGVGSSTIGSAMSLCS